MSSIGPETEGKSERRERNLDGSFVSEPVSDEDDESEVEDMVVEDDELKVVDEEEDDEVEVVDEEEDVEVVDEEEDDESEDVEVIEAIWLTRLVCDSITELSME
jgi:hypothetical protein